MPRTMTMRWNELEVQEFSHNKTPKCNHNGLIINSAFLHNTFLFSFLVLPFLCPVMCFLNLPLTALCWQGEIVQILSEVCSVFSLYHMFSLHNFLSWSPEHQNTWPCTHFSDLRDLQSCKMTLTMSPHDLDNLFFHGSVYDLQSW